MPVKDLAQFHELNRRVFCSSRIEWRKLPQLGLSPRVSLAQAPRISLAQAPRVSSDRLGTPAHTPLQLPDFLDDPCSRREGDWGIGVPGGWPLPRVRKAYDTANLTWEPRSRQKEQLPTSRLPPSADSDPVGHRTSPRRRGGIRGANREPV